MEPILTVIIPVYNDEVNIIRCLESLINQTFKAMSIIVVNDASTDNTLTILKSYQKRYPFTIVNMETNSGAASCRNVGIYAACTPYVTFIDSDDWIDISTYSNCFKQAQEDPDVIIFGLMYDHVTQNRRDQKYHYSKTYRMNGEFALGIYAHTMPNEIRITPIVNNKIYKRDFLLDNAIVFHEGLRYQEDDAFTFEVLAKASKVVIVNGGGYHYCQRSDSLIHTVSEDAIHHFVAAYRALATSLKADGLFEKNKNAFYLKMKGSLLGVIKRVIDFETNTEKRNGLIRLLLILLLENFDISQLLNKLDFSAIRSIL